MRSRRLMTSLGTVAVLFAAAAPARAVELDVTLTPQALVGFGQVTAFVDCPGGFKIPIAAKTEDGQTWQFTLAGAHASCQVTWGNPITFEGTWSPYGSACDAITGTGCPRSMDPTRPGFLALGPVPTPAVVMQTSLNFCIAARCWRGSALVERTPTAFKSSSPPVPLPIGGVAGIGHLTPPGCAPGALKMPITAVTGGGPVWFTVRPGSVGVDCSAVVFGGPIVFAGSWNPDVGGCVGSVTHPGTVVCVSSIPTRGQMTETGLAVCFPTSPVQCWLGFATVLRT